MSIYVKSKFAARVFTYETRSVTVLEIRAINAGLDLIASSSRTGAHANTRK